MQERKRRDSRGPWSTKLITASISSSSNIFWSDSLFPLSILFSIFALTNFRYFRKTLLRSRSRIRIMLLRVKVQYQWRQAWQQIATVHSAC